MKFDITSARSAGYSDDEIADYLASQNNFDLGGALKSGYSASDVVSFLSGSESQAPAPAAAPVTDTGDETARLAARYKAPEKPGLIQRIGTALKPEFKSVMEDYQPTPQEQQANVDRRLSYGAGPISQKTAATADAVRSSRGQMVSKDPTVNKVVKAMDERGDKSFADLVDSANNPVNIRAARDAKADEFRSAGEWAADTLSSLSQGAVGLVQLPINIIAPSSDIAATLNATQKELQAQESDVLKAQRQQLRERVQNEDGFFDKYAATVVQLVTSPALGLSEAVKQVPNFLGIVGAARLAGAASAGAVGVAGRASPTVALGEAISGGAIQAGARAAGTTAGGVGASMVMAGGDAAGGVYDKLTDPKQTPLSVWEQNPDYQKLTSEGKSSKDAIEEIATAKARMAALVTAPLGLLGFMGAEAAVASRGLGKATADALTFAGAGKMLAKDLVGEQFEEGGTQFGGNVISRTVDPSQKLSEGVPEAMATALVTSAPFSAVGAASQFQEARAAQTPDLAGERQAVALFDVNNYDPTLVDPMQTARGGMVGPSAPINFTPMDSPSAQAGLAPIVVPVPAQQETTDVSATSIPPLAAAGGGELASDQFGGGLDVSGLAVDDAAGQRGGLAGAAGANDAQAVSLPGATGQPATRLNRPFDRATDQDLMARTEASIASQENNNDVGPKLIEPWLGRRGDGYVTQADAAQAIGGRQRKFPNLDWKVEQMPNGKFMLAGYEQQISQPAPTVGTTEAGAGTPQPTQAAPITAPSGKPFSTQQTAAVYAQQNGITGYSTVKMDGGWAITPTETTLGTQTPQAIQSQTQGQQAPAIAGAASPGMGQPLATGGAAQAQGGGDAGFGAVATGPVAQPRPAGTLNTPEGAATAGLTASLRLAPPAPLRAVGQALKALTASTGVDAEVDTSPMTEQQQAASAIARLSGRTVTILKADTPGSLPNGFMLPGDSKHVYIANDTEDAPLSVAMHEIYHSLPEPQRKALNTQLLQLFRQDRRSEFAARFNYDPNNDALIDEEIPAFMAQAVSKRADFWQELRTKMGNQEFAEVARVILSRLNAIITGAKAEYGDDFVNKYITDVAKARDLLTTAYAEAMQEQGFTPDAELVGEVMMARRAKTEKFGEYDVATAKDGSITVFGDGEAIRAAMPEGTVGRVTKEGVVFTNAAAPRVRAALEGRQVAYSRGGQVTEKLPMKNGKYLGAPAKFDTPGKIPTLRKILRQLAEEGAPGRYWYENSSREVLKMVGGDVNEARKFVALLAIYSPQAKVDANSTFALRAWAQYKAGQPISVKTGVMDAKAKKAMDNVDEFWSGEKTGNFFFNLLREIDPTTEGKQGATIDMWMMRAGQYDTDAPTSTQYSFMENETNRLAQELGWEPQQVQAAIWVAMKARMENSGVKKMTEASSEKKGWIRYDYPLKNGKPFKTRVIIDAQKHRDNWLKYSFAHDVTKDDTQQAKFDFGDGLKRHIGQVSFEARPGRTTNVLPGIHSAPYAQQVEFQQAVQKTFLDERGNDLLAMKLGLLIDNDILVPGVWQGEISPSTQLGVAMAPAKGDEGKTNVDPAQAKALNVYAAIAGLVARQEGVGWHRPFYSSTKRDANGLDINVGRALNPREVADLETAVGQWMADNGYQGWQDQFAFVSSPNGIRLVNFGIITNEKLHADILRVAESVLPDAEAQWFASSGDMMTNDWKENQNGQDYVERTRAEGRSDVLDWARAYLAPRVQRVFDDFSERYGWGDAGTIQFSKRAGDGSGRQGLGGAQDRQVQAPERADAQTVQGLSATDALPGAPSVRGFTGPDPRLVAVAEQYARDNGITLRRQAEYVQVDPERAARIAAAYEAMPHAPQDLRVKAAYKELIAQTLAQYRALERAGYKFWFINLDKPDNVEYASSPWNAMRDIRANKVMGVFPTDDGFGSGDFDPASNPLLEDTGIKWPSGSLFGPRKRVLANDLFRAVHDAFGHGLEGAGFRAQGEENAWQAHVRLFTGSAVAAITSETRGQNSWLNYGPNGESNRNAKVEDTVFADQKTGLLPEFAWTEGVVGDMPMFSNRVLEDRVGLSRLTYQGYEKAEVPRVQAARKMAGILAKLDAGTITPQEFELQVRLLAERLAEVSATKDANRIVSERARGADIVREKLIAARRRGEVDSDTTEFALWALQQNPAMAEGLGISVREQPENQRGAAGDYNPAAAIMRVFKGSANTGTAVHEILHHTERMMPEAVQTGIRKEWSKAYVKALAKANPVQRAALEEMLKAMAGDPKAQTAVRAAFSDGTLKSDVHYQLTNPSEFWAVNATDILQRRYEAGSWIGRAKQWLSEMVQKAKGLVGMRSNAPLLRGLEAVLNTDGKRQSKKMLAEGDVFEDVSAPEIRSSNRRQKLIGSNFEVESTSNIDAARIKLQDDALRMKRVIEAVKAKGGTVGEAQNFYDANTLMPGRIQAAIDDFKNNVVRPMLDKAAEFGIDMDELSMYAYAKHAKERNAYIASINKRLPDGGSGMTNAEADNIIQLVNLAGDTAKFEELHQALMGITSATRQIMLSEGLITPDEFTTLEGAYDNYIPLRGFESVDEETGVARPGVGRGVNVRGAETVRAMGRKSKAGDLIENVIRDYERVIGRVEKNDVAKVLLDFVLSNPDPDLWGVDVERSRPSFNKAQGTVQYTKSIEKGEDTIGLKVGGEQVYIKFADKELTRALRQAWKDETSGLERATLAMTGWWNNWLRAVLTKYNPAFALINIPRDALWSGTASALAELGPKGLASYLAAYPKAFMASARQEAGFAGTSSKLFGNPQMDARFAEFRSAGGITGGFFMRTLDDINQELRNELLMAGASARNPWEQVKKLPPFKLAKMTLKLLEFMGAASENATRFALYQASREQGNSPAKAGILAKDGTTNFNRKGEFGGALNNLYLFFNAAVQGNAQLFRVLKSPAVQASMAGVAGVGMMLALYGASSGGEDEDGEAYWDKIPSYIKERNMVIMLPPGDALAGGIERVGKRGRYITIPVQYGFNIFPNVGYVMADVLRNAKDPKRGMTPTKAALHMTSTVLGSINPFGGAVDVSDGVQVLLAAMPTLADLPIQLINERGTFGSPSSPSKSPFDLRPDSERMFTSQQDSVSAKIAEALNELGGGNEARAGKIMGVETSVTPGTIQTLISATTGGLGTFIEQVGTSVISMTGDDQQPKASKIPFLNKFYGEVDEGANIKTAGDRMREVKKLSDEVKAQQKLGLDPKLTSEEDRLLSLAGMQATYQRQSTMIRKAELEIIKDDSKTKAEKALEKQRLQVERDKLATDMNREYLRVVPK